MSIKEGEIYNIKESVLKYRFCCDYIRIARISLKTITLEPCFRKDNLIYKKALSSRRRIYKKIFNEELENGKIKLV